MQLLMYCKGGRYGIFISRATMYGNFSFNTVTIPIESYHKLNYLNRIHHTDFLTTISDDNIVMIEIMPGLEAAELQHSSFFQVIKPAISHLLLQLIILLKHDYRPHVIRNLCYKIRVNYRCFYILLY